jgi:hypothetical protein
MGAAFSKQHLERRERFTVAPLEGVNDGWGSGGATGINRRAGGGQFIDVF